MEEREEDKLFLDDNPMESIYLGSIDDEMQEELIHNIFG